MNMNTPVTTQQVTVRKTARGMRVWIEDTKHNSRLSNAGFTAKARYDRTIKDGVITMTLNPEGKKGVSGKAYPLIDTSGKQLDGFEIGDELTAYYFDGQIIIKKGA